MNIQTFDNTGYSDDDPRYQSVDEVSKMETLATDRKDDTLKVEDQYAKIQKKPKRKDNTNSISKDNTDKDSTL